MVLYLPETNCVPAWDEQQEKRKKTAEKKKNSRKNIKDTGKYTSLEGLLIVIGAQLGTPFKPHNGMLFVMFEGFQGGVLNWGTHDAERRQSLGQLHARSL